MTLISHDNLSVSFFWSTNRFITNHGSPIYRLLCSATASPAAPMWRVTRWRSWTSCPTTWWSTWSSRPSLPVCWCRRRTRRPSSSSPTWGYVGRGAKKQNKVKLCGGGVKPFKAPFDSPNLMRAHLWRLDHPVWSVCIYLLSGSSFL